MVPFFRNFGSFRYRYFYVISFPCLIISSVFSILLFEFLATAEAIEAWTSVTNHAFQLIVILLGVNVIGVTHSLNSHSQSSEIRALKADIDECTNEIAAKFIDDRRSKPRRMSFVRTLLNRIKVEQLIFSDDDQDEIFYIHRPYWDGAWYQILNSPFANEENSQRRQAIAYSHEAVLCALSLLRVLSQLRNSGSWRLSKEYGTQGTKWFLEELEAFQIKNDDFHPKSLPKRCDIETAKEIIWLSLYSTHYITEEYQEMASEINWDAKN